MIRVGIKKETDKLNGSTKSHIKKVAEFAGQYADYKEMSATDKEFLINAGYIHDIGKFFVSLELLEKPDKLTDEEFEEIKQHTINGYKYCLQKEGLEEFADIVHQHHEKLDGSGYPRNLVGEEISGFAKIVTVIDIYEAITSQDRDYRNGVNHEKAKTVLWEEVASGKIDGDIVNNFMQMRDTTLQLEAIQNNPEQGLNLSVLLRKSESEVLFNAYVKEFLTANNSTWTVNANEIIATKMLMDGKSGLTVQHALKYSPEKMDGIRDFVRKLEKKTEVKLALKELKSQNNSQGGGRSF